jgi:CRP-like cAMP-binding protein
MSKFFIIRFVPAGQLLFEIGSAGKEFFIILKGECVFFKKCNDSEKEMLKNKVKHLQTLVCDPDENPPKKRFRSNYADVPKISKLMHSTVEKKEGEFYVYHMGNLMNQINRMCTGQTFGEIALMSTESIRMATVLCTKDTEFAVLDRHNYNVNISQAGNNGRYQIEGTTIEDRYPKKA